jgi:hypothetical protein
MRQNKQCLSLAPVLLQEKRQIERAAEAESVPAHARGIKQGHVGEALEQHWQQDGANGSPRQVRARAMEVNRLKRGKMLPCVAPRAKNRPRD